MIIIVIIITTGIFIIIIIIYVVVVVVVIIIVRGEFLLVALWYSFTFVFGVLPSSKERITSFLFNFCFSLPVRCQGSYWYFSSYPFHILNHQDLKISIIQAASPIAMQYLTYNHFN